MPLRDEEEVRATLLEQAGDNDGATQLLSILRWSLAGNAAAKRARLLSFLDGGWSCFWHGPWCKAECPGLKPVTVSDMDAADLP